MKLLLSFYRILNILSIDVAAGAAIGALFFGRILEVNILPQGIISLALTVWIIYTIDHLRDASKIMHEASSARHRFHQRYFKILVISVFIALLSDLVLSFFIRRQVLIGGMSLGVLVLFYLFIHPKIFYLKEFLIAVLYTAGVTLPAVSISTHTVSLIDSIFILQFFLLALLNLIIFSWFDLENDLHDNLKSFVVHTGKSFSARLIIILFILFAALAAISFCVDVGKEEAVLCSMAIVLLMVYIFRREFSKNEYYRLLGDAIFLFPIAIL